MAIGPVQEIEVGAPLGGQDTIDLPAPPTEGNLLTLAVAVRLPSAETLTAPDGWTAHPDGTTFTTAGNTSLSTFYRLAGAGETTEVAIVGQGTGAGSRWLAHCQEWSGVGTLDLAAINVDDVSSTVTSGSVTPTAGVEALIYTAAALTKGDGFNVTVTPGTDVTELWDAEATANSPQGWAGYRIVAVTSGSYELTGSILSGGSPLSLDTAVHTLVFTAAVDEPEPGWWIDWDKDGFDDSVTVGSGLVRLMPSGTSSVSDNVTEYVRTTPVNWTRGASADHTGGADPGSITFRLFDPTDPDKFNPDNTASPFYGKLVPGLPVWGGINADGTWSGTGQTVHGLAAGYTREFVPVIVDGAVIGCDVICDDPLAYYAEQPVNVAPALGRSVKAFRGLVLDAIGESADRRDLADEIDTLVVSSVDSDNALGVLEELNRATGTRHFVKPADNKDDWYFYTTVNKLHGLTSAADVELDGDDVDAVSNYRVTRRNIVNRQRASVSAISLTPDTVTVWTYGEAPFTVTTARRLVVFAEFDDFVFNAAVQTTVSSGTISTTLTNFGKSAKIEVYATSPAATIGSLIVTGQAIRRADPVLVIAENAASQARYGVRGAGDISSDFIGAPTTAQGLVDFLVWKFATPLFRPDITVTTKNAATRSFCYARDCYDVITTSIDRLNTVTKRFEIVGLSGSVAPGGPVSVDYQLQQTPNSSAITGWFTLDSSSLDGGDVLAPF